jgi:hypothetical protein
MDIDLRGGVPVGAVGQRFTPAYRVEAVGLVEVWGRLVAQIARDLINPAFRRGRQIP